jgi:hypothetical protein
MTVRSGTVSGGQLVLSEPLPLPDGTKVVIRVEAAQDNPLLFIAKNAVDLGVDDSADEHDHYIYGSPKRSE